MKTTHLPLSLSPQYADRFEINLDNLAPQVALYPSPDNVVPVTECAGMVLDGCFIGACTTAEEELILAGMLLEAGLKQGMCLDLSVLLPIVD